MAEQVPKTAHDTAPQAATTTTTTTTTTTEEVDVVADVVVQDSSPSSHSTPPPPPLPENENEKEKETDDETEKQKLENEKEKLEKEKEKEASPLPRPVPETEAETDQEEKQPALKPDTTESYDDKIPESGSFFKEESTRLSDLPDPERKALHDLKLLVREALHNHLFSSTSSSSSPKTEESQDNDKEKEKPAHEKEEAEGNIKAETAPAKKSPEQEEEPAEEETSEVAVHHVTDDDGAKTVEAIEETIVAVSAPQPKEADKDTQDMENKTKDESLAAQSQSQSQPQPQPQPQEVCIWGIPLLADDRSDVILLKFLRARDLKVKDAFTMLKNTISWRKEFVIDQLAEVEVEEESNRCDLEKAVFMHGQDREGHPVCYNVFGEFQNKELYQKTFSDEEKRQKFLRWRIQFLERSIRKLDFSPGGVCTIVQVNDLHNSPGPSKWELRQATKQALHLLQDNYPEFVAKQVFINVPWWYMAVNRMISPFLTQRTKSKFVFAGPSKSAQTLLRYIGAEQIPVKYGGLSKDGEFDATDAVTEITLRPAAKHTVEFPATERCVVSWEVRVGGGEVKYGAEFVPSAEESYTVIIQKTRKLSSSRRSSSAAAAAQDHPLPVVSNSFKIGEPGKVVLTIENPTSKKKKLLYRLKSKPFSDAPHKCA